MYQGCDREQLFNDENTFEVEKIISKDYWATGNGDDIAILKLKKPIRMTSGDPKDVMPVCLPSQGSGYDNLVVAGWGNVNVNGKAKESECLNEADLTLVGDALCNLYYQPNIRKVMCAGGWTGTCQGDSGGPLMSRIDGRVFQVGISSFARVDCGINSHFPSAFERVTAHSEWIRQTTNGEACFK